MADQQPNKPEDSRKPDNLGGTGAAQVPPGSKTGGDTRPGAGGNASVGGPGGPDAGSNAMPGQSNAL
jgi:hypothetical protein